MKRRKNRLHSDESGKDYRSINRKVSFLSGLLIIVFVIGILAYPEQFQFRSDALSYLGEIYSRNGKSNILSFIIFNFGMIGCALICFSAARDLRKTDTKYYFVFAAIGFFLLAIPSDVFNILHSIGGALTIGSLWLFSTITLNEIYRKTAIFKILIYQVVLQGAVLPYAFLYFAGLPSRQYAQKIAVIGLMIILKIAVYEYSVYLKKDFEQAK